MCALVTLLKMERDLHKQSPSQAQLRNFFTAAHECKMKEIYLENTKQEVDSLEKEVELMRLEDKWCFNNIGERIIPTAENQAAEICEHIKTDEDLVKEVVKALRMKKLDLQINIKKLKEMCDTLKEEGK